MFHYVVQEAAPGCKAASISGQKLHQGNSLAKYFYVHFAGKCLTLQTVVEQSGNQVA